MKYVAVTGAFGVLGSAVVAALSQAGVQVAAIDRAPRPANASGTVFADVDITDFAVATRVMNAAAQALGGLDGLVNIAGGFRWETVADGDVATWDFLYAINLKTALCASKAALLHLAEASGAIVNVSAAATAKAGAGMGAYTASKSGVSRLTEALAEEMKGRVRVNAVLPSIIDTPQNRKDMPDADFAKWVAPEALADAILFLLSPKARAITGALVPVVGLV